MTQFELVEADFKAKTGVLEAERRYLRSQIDYLEAQIQQNKVKELDLQNQWENYLNSIKEQAIKNGEGDADLVKEAPKSKSLKKS